MNITVTNKSVIIKNIDAQLKCIIEEELIYTDKSKQYQLKRMARTTWGMRSPLYAKLQSEVKGKLYEVHSDGSYEISSCFFKTIADASKSISDALFDSLFTNIGSNLIDQRKDTGAKISLPWVKKPHDLRDYQEEAAEAMDNNWRGTINFATGLGKTLLAVHYVRRYKRKALIVCPGQSVATQFYEQLVEAFGEKRVGYYGGGKKKIRDITVGIAASVSKHIEEFKQADLGLVIIDETHHTPASTFFDIAKGLSDVGKIFGLTATDYRSDGKDIMITGGCGPVIAKKDIVWGIQQGWLATPCFIVREIKTGGRDFKDDKLKSYKEHVLNSKIMKDRILSDAQKMMAAGKAVLILVDEVAHGQELATQLGIPFATGLDKDSQDYVDQLNAGKVPGLVGTDGKVGEGTDTRNVDVLILANFVASKGPVIQAIGRALRKTATKSKCLILDYIPVDSTMLSRHGNKRVSFYKEITDQVVVHAV